MAELENCLKQKDTAPGEDNITYSMIYNLPEDVKIFLLYLYNCVYQSGNIPTQWRNITVLPIFKVGSSSLAEVKLRPISLISCLCKTFHLMILRRLEWYFEQQKIFSLYTVGFRKAQSCADALTRLVSYIQIGLSKNIPTLACFLDIKNAYNNVNVDKVIKILDEFNVGTKICKYLWDFLSKRNLRVRAESGDVLLSRYANRGLAQGDPLSPLLFNIATHQICKLAQEGGVLMSQYADDFVIYFANKDLHICERRVQEVLNSSISILNCLGLDVSTSKTSFCFFSRGRRRILPSLNINGDTITPSEQVKYLGMWLDRSLLWKKHINYVVERCSKFLNLLRVLAGSNWGIHPKHVRRIYIAIVRSRIDYVSYLFDSSVKTNVSKLDKLQNQAMRIIGGFVKSSPIHVMECELSLPPLHLRRLFLAMKYCLKAFSWANNITIDIISELSDMCSNNYWANKKHPLLVKAYKETKDTEVSCSNPLEMFTLKIWVSGIDVKNTVASNLESVLKSKSSYDSNRLKVDVARELNEKYGMWHKIFTDGSKSGNNRGAAFYDSSRDQMRTFKIKNDVSIMTLELIAISAAITHAYSVRPTSTVIFSDSKSALQHLARCASAYRGLPAAYTVLQKIYDFRQSGRQLRLQWVPAHIGLKGNEEADRLAKLGSKIGTDINAIPFYAERLLKFKNLAYSQWKLYFDERSRIKGIWYRTIQCEPLRVPWFEQNKIRSQQTKLAFRIRSGHYPCNKFAYLMKKTDSPNCDVCGKLEDVLHLLMECRRNQRERELLMSRYDLSCINVGVAQSAFSSPTSEIAMSFYQLVAAAHR